MVKQRADWAALPDEKLLEVRMCDLDLRIEGTILEARIGQLLGDLRERGLLFRPHFWLSDEWFSPDGVPGVAIPFYLAHPRLARLEERQMLEVEGGDEAWCMKILRHETGHAIDNAFRLRRVKKRREIFGNPRVPYPEYYSAKPYSKSFVLHLDPWYAQSHPDEDFAETFAVWFTPSFAWEDRYAGWPALKKLRYMDELMKSLAGKKPPVVTRKQVDPLRSIRKTLGEHYEARKRHYGKEHPSFYDKDLRRLFTDDQSASGRSASVFLRSVRREIRATVARWTGTYQYTIDRVLAEMISRCSELKLRLKTSEEDAKRDFSILLTVQTMNHLHSGRHMIAL